MNEDLQQALAELITMVKSGLSSLPPFLERLSHELVVVQVTNGCVGLVICLLSLILSAVALTNIHSTKHEIDYDVKYMATMLISAIIVCASLGIWVCVTSITQGLFAPTTVLIDYLQKVAR